MKFTELLIAIIVFLAIVSFVTDCNGQGSAQFIKLFKTVGMITNKS